MVQPSPVTPEAAQEGAGPNIPIHPDAFGATVAGQGLSELGAAAGQGAKELGSAALEYQSINNQNAADAASFKNSRAASLSLEQYQKDLVAQLHDNPGLDTIAYSNAFLKQREEARSALGQTLGSPAAQLIYNNDTRRSGQILESNVRAFTANTWKDAAIAMQDGKIDQARLGLAAAGVDNPQALSAAMQQIGEAVAAKGRLKPLDPQAEILKAVSPVFLGAITGKAASGDILGAKSLLDAHRGSMTFDAQMEAERMLRVGDFNNNIAGIADQAIGETGGRIQAGPAAASGPAVTPTASPHLTPITSRGGQTAQVDARYAPQFQGFIKDLEAEGYPVHAVEGYANRNVAGTHDQSFHAQGAAIDINPGQNQVNGKTDLPANVGALAAKWGLGWGGNWTSKKDYMHFSVAQSEGGSVDLSRGEGNPAQNGMVGSYALKDQLGPAIARARDLAAQMYPGNVAAQDTAEARVRTRLGLQIDVAQNQETYAFGQLDGAAAADLRIQDLPSLLSSVPNGQAIYASLPGPQQRAIQAQVQENANQYTLDRAHNEQILDGMAATAGQNDDFKNADLFNGPYSDLTAGSRRRFINEQQQLKNPNNPVYKQQADAKYQALVAVPQVGQIIKSMFETPGTAASDTGGGTTPVTYSQAHLAFLGALKGEVDRAQAANGGKPLTQDQIGTLANNLVLNRAHTFAYVPSAVTASITRGFYRTNHRAPTPQELVEIYHRNLTNGQ